MELSRRDFLASSAVVGTGAVTLAALAGAASPASAGETPWDKEADIVVVGSGTAAMGAISAMSLGAESVILLEKSGVWGGTSATSGCGSWVPCAYCQADAGVEDTPEMAREYMLKTTGGRVDESVALAYLDAAPKFVQWTHDTFDWEWYCGPNGGDYFDAYEGSLGGGRTIFVKFDEGNLWSHAEQIANDLGVEVLFETPATSLVTDETGAVVGVLATTKDGAELRVHAKKGVILGTGGFDHNLAMIKAFQPNRPYVTNASMGDTGDGHLMGMAVGADLAHMDTNWGLPCFYDGELDPSADMVTDFRTNDWFMYRTKPNAIVVNKYGKRFGNESSAYAIFNRAWEEWDTGLQEYRNLPAYFICDSEFTQYFTLPGQAAVGDPMPEYVVSADTLEELAEKLGIDPEGLTAEVEAFNANAEKGADPQWHRGEKAYDQNTSADMTSGRDLPSMSLGPVATAPFYGALYVPGTCGTNGGLLVDANSQIVNVWGETIPGLYAVGNCSAGVSGGAYCGGGMTIGAGIVMSWVAVHHMLGIAE
ncbi:MAG: FAD-binding protein [Coriobacteriia bacterium]|nr:FAD-binding protein [Coriobacteriia bacterium]MBS5478304.1 FAD-binding protein [Coriobacteriia bacterium]